jgi:hypothetical protein
MMDDPSYRSFMVRLWHEPETSEATWHGEVEHIQSGRVVTVSSLEEIFHLIRHTAAAAQQPVSDTSQDGELVE